MPPSARLQTVHRTAEMTNNDWSLVTPNGPTVTTRGVLYGVALEDSAVPVPTSQDDVSHRPVNRRRFFAKI